MTRLYLVDAYNVILQDPELNEILDYEGLAASRRAMRDVAERFARHSGSRIRLVFDGARDPFSHNENFENEWIEVSFTSGEEKADERVVAVALEWRRHGLKPIVVSDDIVGIREPLEALGFSLMATRKFAGLLRSPERHPVEIRGESLPETTRRSIEEEFLARDAEARRRRDLEAKDRAAAPRLPAAAAPPAGSPKEAAAARAPSPPRTPKLLPVAPVPPLPARGDGAKKERGLRKQARRLALLQSRRRNKS